MSAKEGFTETCLAKPVSVSDWRLLDSSERLASNSRMDQSRLSRKSSSFGARLQRFSTQPSAVLTIEPTREVEESSPPADRPAQIPAHTPAGEREDSPITEPLLGNEVQPEQQITGPTSSNKDELDRKMDFAYNISLIVNVALFAAKIYAFAVSHSKSVLASCADSLVDIASQLVLALADYKVAKADPKFPVGRTRLEAVGESQLLEIPRSTCVCSR